MRFWLTLPLVVLSVSIGAGACLAQGYPSRAVKLIVPFPPGGATDVIARTIASRLATQFGQPVVVENKGGAGGTIGAAEAARASADGYTIFIGEPGCLSIAASVQRNLSYDPVRDFAPISQVVTVPMLLVAHPTAGARSLSDLVAQGRARNASYNYGSPGAGTVQHLTMEQLRLDSGLAFVHVPYKGGGPALNDLLGGQIPLLMVTLPTVSAHIKAGKLVPLAILSRSRNPQIPDVQTVAEAGFAGFEQGIWQGLLAPAGTPREIVSQLNAEIHKAMRASEVKERLESIGAEVTVGAAEAFSELIRADVQRWAKVVKDSGITLN